MLIFLLINTSAGVHVLFIVLGTSQLTDPGLGGRTTLTQNISNLHQFFFKVFLIPPPQPNNLSPISLKFREDFFKFDLCFWNYCTVPNLYSSFNSHCFQKIFHSRENNITTSIFFHTFSVILRE